MSRIDNSVMITVKLKVRVRSLRMKASPLSESSFSARTSTGTTRAVSTAPSTSSVMRLGSVLAVLNAEATAGPSTEPMSTMRIKPVMREISVAMAMEPPARTTWASEVCSSLPSVSVFFPDAPSASSA